MSTANKVLKNTGFLYAKMGITMFISLYTTRLVLNGLGAVDFGIFNVVGGAIAMLGFLHAAMAGATQRFMSFYEGKGELNKQKQIFNVSLVLHFFIALILGLVLLIAGYFFFNGVLNIPEARIYAAKVVYTSLIVSTLFTVMSVPYEAVLNAHENMLYYSIVGVLESLLKLTVALVIVNYVGDKLELYGILMACIPLVVLTIMRIYCHKKYRECVIAPKRFWNKLLMKEMASFAGWNLLGNGSGLIGNYGNALVVNHFFGAVVNAALGVANQLNGQLMAFSNNMIKALNPVIVKKQGAGDQKSMMYFSLLGSKMSFLILAFFAIPVIVETPYILKLWLKQIPEWTIIFLRLALFQRLLEQLTVTLTTSLNAHGNIKGLNISSLASNLLPLIVLYLLFVNGFPPYWLYIVTIALMVVLGTGFKVYFCIKLCSLKLKDLFRIVILPCVFVFTSAIVSGYLLCLGINEGLLRLVLVVLVSFVVFSISSYLVLNNKEKEVIIGLKDKIIKKK
ncbi:hypothetical protein [Wenyingzhuangia sp. 2_MG-2023]|uniref:hypothetical protein n=1 Tax=Wenyingzhuangia sp. 2_MG-2023 TaxID=3062639 RepID=UPI0026E3D309|nr:hypothetical protein [Wenyingzhuangia sp. 2_MG-2023]MDO6739097.1 hypothetical protein [Wenyingzhuangia sp. 2_MG-2023]